MEVFQTRMPWLCPDASALGGVRLHVASHVVPVVEGATEGRGEGMTEKENHVHPHAFIPGVRHPRPVWPLAPQLDVTIPS